MPIGLFVADHIFNNHNNFLKGIMFAGACKAICVCKYVCMLKRVFPEIQKDNKQLPWVFIYVYNTIF